MNNSGIDNQKINMTIQQALQWAKHQLIDGESAILDARILLCHVLECEPVTLMTYPEKVLTEEQESQFQHLVNLRLEGRPIAHLVGYRDFWTLRLQVSEKTLIPRPETELLVEHALELPIPAEAKVLDLGTGTGAIALSLASENPKWQVLGVDYDQEIIDLAKKNALSNDINNVSFTKSNWFSDVDEQEFDLIVSNPPYVEQDSPYLNQGDVRFEPLTALVADQDGLEDIKTIIEKSRTKINIGGWLIVEHGFQQGESVHSLFLEFGFKHVQTVKDLNDCERITKAQWC